MMAAMDSPDTLPSLAESSVDLTPHEKLSRTLFPSTEIRFDDMMTMMNMKKDGGVPAHHAFHDEECSEIEDPHSVASIDLVPPSQSDWQGVKRSIFTQSEHFLKCDDPPEAKEISPAAKGRLGALSRKQLNLFALFDANHKPKVWSAGQPMICGSARSCFNDWDQESTFVSESTNKHANTPNKAHWLEERWRVKAESLERECRALKQLHWIDMLNVRKHKAALEQICKREKLYKQEMFAAKAELKKATTCIEILSREHEDCSHREEQHLETIKFLKAEINDLTDKNTAIVEEPSNDMKQIDRLRLDNDLYAARVVQQERQISRVYTALGLKEAQNEELRLMMSALQNAMEAKEEDEEPGAISASTMGARLLHADRQDLPLSQTTVPLLTACPVNPTTGHSNTNYSRAPEANKDLMEEALDTSSAVTVPVDEPDISPQPGPMQLEIASLSALLKEKEAEIRGLKAQLQLRDAQKNRQPKDDCDPLHVISDWCGR